MYTPTTPHHHHHTHIHSQQKNRHTIQLRLTNDSQIAVTKSVAPGVADVALNAHDVIFCDVMDGEGGPVSI